MLTSCLLFQATLERSEKDTHQRLNNQLEKQEREISQLQKRLENEVEQRHLLSRNQEVKRFPTTKVHRPTKPRNWIFQTYPLRSVFRKCDQFLILQIQLMEAKRQLETQVALHQKTKELLNAAEMELNTHRLQQGSGEARHTLSSPSMSSIRGWHKHTHST